MTKTVHMCVDIRGLMQRPKRELKNWFCKLDGRYATASEAWDYLADELAKGHKVLPYGPECEGFSYETGCPGHEVHGE
jgi:hypothetical protein